MTEDIHSFQETVWEYYRQHGRHDLPWRTLESDGTVDPYKVLVSELMLQQTQVPRVLPKFREFLERFPTVAALASVPLSEVLKAWSGLGYNRRAKFLWQTAQAVVRQYNGVLPRTLPELVALPGIGPNTAGAILAYAFNQPIAYIETNIRTVFIYHFFPDQEAVADRDLVPFIEAALPRDEARDWYWALMDYGSHLKQTVGNVARSSASYSRQSAFHGSRRQIRGQVLKLLAVQPQALTTITAAIPDERLPGVLQDLTDEGFIQSSDGLLHLAS
ncbi:MAG TPA: hypothetical protein VD735_06980 [Candidatus Saccharimonadales bacterium]|nr:hypothetical protein [Candidatus Saccharimonadales bacterium]